MRTILSVVTILSALALVAGFFGRIEPALDTLSLGRPAFALFCFLGIFALKRRWLRATCIAIACVGATSVLLPLRVGTGESSLRVYSKNMRHTYADAQALAQDILSQEVDAVLLQEVPTENTALLALLRDQFPHQHVCPFGRTKGIAVLSRAPITAKPRCTHDRVLAAAQIDWKGAPIWLVSSHIPWPWPNDARVAEQQAHDLLAQLEGPIVMAGDFNMVPWSARVQGYARATGTRLAGPMHITFERLPVPLSIDHVMAPGGGRVELRPMLGSDHAGLVADVRL